MLSSVTEITGNKFIIIIDEWDALFREAKEDTDLQEEYIQLMRSLFKSSLTDKMIEAAYITGILPIKNMEPNRHLPILTNILCFNQSHWKNM